MASNGHARVEMKPGDSGSAGATRNSQTSRAVFIAVTAAALGITYGYDISNTAAALQFVQRDFGIYSAINTASVVGQIAGAILGGPMANAIGRKKSMLVIAAGYTIFAILTAISPSAGLFLAMRVLLGITIGLSITVVPVFIAESAPASRRGGLATAYQVTCVVGIILGVPRRLFPAAYGHVALDSRCRSRPSIYCAPDACSHPGNPLLVHAQGA